MANTAPVGEDAWVALAEEHARHANDLLGRIEVVELLKQAVSSEPGSLKTWMAYCDYFWSLRAACQPHSDAGWAPEEQAEGRELFSLDAALNLWQQGYEATRYRLNDSHVLWNRWISLEMELLAQTRTPEGVRRITHLFRNRLQTPHAAWDETSQMFSSFLSEYNRSAWEGTMQEVTQLAVFAKKLYGARDGFESRLSDAARAEDVETQKLVMTEYLDWEMRQANKDRKNQGILVEICLGLYSRALTGLFTRNDGVWTDYIVWVSSLHMIYNQNQAVEMLQILPNVLDIMRRAVQHCPWAGDLWARYILTAEEAGLTFHDIERIKHAATASSQLDRDDMTGVLEMYAAWCGYLKRRAMYPTATDEDVDIADLGLVTALEDVQIWGNRRYGDEYKGDPDFRLHRILIQYLTEKNRAIDEARSHWEGLACQDLYANSYNFWLTWYMWEMLVFQTQKGNGRSPTPAPPTKGLRVPSEATEVLVRAVRRRQLDWPERVLEIYLQHCNDYETPETLRRASDTVHKARKGVAKRRAEEAAAANAAYAAQYAAQPAEETPTDLEEGESSFGAKRKREAATEDDAENTSKRVKNEPVDSAPSETTRSEQNLKRDRENTSILVSGLPADATQTKIRQYFREYGHIKNLSSKVDKDGRASASFIEFETPEEAQSALLRDGKYFGQHQITVRPGTRLTVFVTNYPPQADEVYMRELFEECGEVFSIRWPSLKFNTHRRFCYVTFRDDDASARATQLDGTLLEGKYKLQAKYSDPSLKKKRDGAIEEGREVHVTNLPLNAEEQDVKTVFDRYGVIERVRIPTTKAGKSRGTAFVVFDTTEQAEAAIAELHSTKFRNQILNVELSKPVNYKPKANAGPDASVSPSPEPSIKKDEEGDEIMPDHEPSITSASASGHSVAERTFALMGIPDTLNDVRVRALIEPYGKLVRFTLEPSHGGAVLEYPDVATAGKAELALSGLEVEGRRLRTGSVTDLRKQKGEIRIDRIDQPAAAKKQDTKKSTATLMPPPSTFRRPILGKAGAKRGLGFGGAINKSTTKDTATIEKTNGVEPTPAAAAAAGVKKNNADFRAMLLNKGDNSNNNNQQQATPTPPTQNGENGNGAEA